MSNGVDIKGFGFEASDVFACLVPGSVLLAGLYVHTQLFDVAPVLTVMGKTVPYWNSQTPTWFQSAILISVFLFSAYVVGHIVASFSAAIVDKLLMERIYGYPYERLFNKKLGASKYERNKRYIYKFILAMSTSALVYFAIVGVLDWVVIAAVGLASVVLVLKVIMTALIQRDMRNSADLRPETDWRRKLGDWLWLYGISWWCKFISRLIFDSVGYTLLALFRMCKPFRIAFQDLFVIQFHTTFGIQACDVGTDAFWLVYSFVVQRRDISRRFIDHWLHLYSFCRNLGMCFLLLFIYGAIMRSLGKGGQYYIGWSVITGVGALTLILRFFYIYYNYFSKYVFRVFVATWKPGKGGGGSRICSCPGETPGAALAGLLPGGGNF